MGFGLAALRTVESSVMRTRQGEVRTFPDISDRHTRHDSLGCGKKISEPISLRKHLYFSCVLHTLMVQWHCVLQIAVLLVWGNSMLKKDGGRFEKMRTAALDNQCNNNDKGMYHSAYRGVGPAWGLLCSSLTEKQKSLPEA